MRASFLLLAITAAGRAEAQAIVSSSKPDRVSVTVYRDPDRGLEPLNLQWLGGYALVSETRRVQLPPGESELRFVGVTSGIVPQTAIVTGLGEAVLEKNRDARLLSPRALLDAILGERLHLRRRPGRLEVTREQDAIVRAANDGVVIQTGRRRGDAAMHRLVGNSVGESRARRPVGEANSIGAGTEPSRGRAGSHAFVPDQQLRLAGRLRRRIIGSWRPHIVVRVADHGKWRHTGLEDAQTQAVAGKLNRQRVWVDPGVAKPISIQCWPQGTTSDIPEESEVISVTGSPIKAYDVAPRAPPPPPPTAPGT